MVQQIPGLEIRFTVEEDGEAWRRWLTQKDVEAFYPMANEHERNESVKRLQSFCKYRCALTAVLDGEVAGIAYVNLHPYRKIAHQGLFTIIVDEKFRGKGIGRALLESLERLSRDSFKLESLHLEVYEGNPAIRLYRRMGYREFGFQGHWIKEGPGDYRGKIFMEKWF
jgi:ribosomal protein S18 acetylase RimI-like enzyme